MFEILWLRKGKKLFTIKLNSVRVFVAKKKPKKHTTKALKLVVKFQQNFQMIRYF